MLTASPAQSPRRPNGAPAYYLGRPAAVWITAMSPRPTRTERRYLDLTRRPVFRTIRIPRPRKPQLREAVGVLPRQRSQQG